MWQAEKLLKKLHAAKNLHNATVARKLTALEQAIDAVKKGGWEKDFQREMQDANALLEKVRRTTGNENHHLVGQCSYSAFHPCKC